MKTNKHINKPRKYNLNNNNPQLKKMISIKKKKLSEDQTALGRLGTTNEVADFCLGLIENLLNRNEFLFS